MAAHTITIPGIDGQRITLKELRTSAIVTGGIATFDIPDHIWYDDYEDYLQETMSVTVSPYVVSDSGKQTALEQIHYDIDIPLSPIELLTPDTPYKVVSTALSNIVFNVREGSTVTINGEDYSDLVNTEGGRVSYNATVQPIGENVFQIVVRSQYCRENSMTVTLYREKQEIPLDLASDIATSASSSTMLVRATTLPGAIVKVLSPYSDLDITTMDTDGSFSFQAKFDKIGDNTIPAKPPLGWNIPSIMCPMLTPIPEKHGAPQINTTTSSTIWISARPIPRSTNARALLLPSKPPSPSAPT